MPTLYAGLRETLRVVISRTKLAARYQQALSDPVFWEGFVTSIPPLTVPVPTAGSAGVFSSMHLPLAAGDGVTTGDVDGESVSEDPYLADWTNIATPGPLGIPSPGPGERMTRSYGDSFSSTWHLGRRGRRQPHHLWWGR